VRTPRARSRAAREDFDALIIDVYLGGHGPTVIAIARQNRPGRAAVSSRCRPAASGAPRDAAGANIS
jgi:hypothetical protein